MNKSLLVAIVVVALLALGGYYFYTRQGGYQVTAPATQTQQVQQEPEATEPVTGETEAEEETETREIRVGGDEYSFSPANITLEAGERIRLTFVNAGSLPHNLTVEGLGIATRTIGAGQSDSIEFTVEEGGTYTTFCSVGNHRAQGMEGTLEIQ